FQVEDHNLDDVLRVLPDMGVQNLTITPPSLEDLFLRHYGTGEGARR
ncbi:MAG: ABC transporter ATP-binding protein, partial [Corynebacterium marinum]|nr:ABC transporter ATP-binding protein [Corynebacterium marinum]